MAMSSSGHPPPLVAAWVEGALKKLQAQNCPCRMATKRRRYHLHSSGKLTGCTFEAMAIESSWVFPWKMMMFNDFPYFFLVLVTDILLYSRTHIPGSSAVPRVNFYETIGGGGWYIRWVESRHRNSYILMCPRLGWMDLPLSWFSRGDSQCMAWSAPILYFVPRYCKWLRNGGSWFRGRQWWTSRVPMFVDIFSPKKLHTSHDSSYVFFFGCHVITDSNIENINEYYRCILYSLNPVFIGYLNASWCILQPFNW